MQFPADRSLPGIALSIKIKFLLNMLRAESMKMILQLVLMAAQIPHQQGQLVGQHDDPADDITVG